MQRAIGLPAVLIATATAAGCGDDGREDVERYIREANAVQQRFAPQLREANAAYARFAEGDLDELAADRQLTGAEQALHDARRALARLDPPKQAEALHQRLLRVYAANAEFAGETTQLGRYLPQARTTLRPVAGISRRLRERLEDADAPGEQAAAFGLYARGIYGQFSGLRRLDPPPILFATHQAQLLRLDRSNRLARRLQRATRRRDAAEVAELLLRFRRATRDARGTTLTRTAIRAYNERYRKVSAAAIAVRREQQRLERAFA